MKFARSSCPCLGVKGKGVYNFVLVTQTCRAGAVLSVCLSTQEITTPALHKLDMVVNACTPTTGEVETKKVKFKVLFWSPRKFRGQPTFNPFKTNKTVSVLPTRRRV